ncbi:MAG: dTMP kinase [Deltaproteobacteria bacterium]|nr:dTMP kinase [Deltaproteobacteria bacterium]MBW1952270.1 dTMP kinase [Deltaproteobacteria bacterium]
MGQEFPGFLIALEGLDGAGKTTQAHLLTTALKNGGRRVVLTHEPTEGRYGQELRRLLAQGHRVLSPARELDLFTADRREHVSGIILPALTSGAVVITDRYYYSSMAYQGARGLEVVEIQQQNESFAPIPDLVIILTLPLTQILERLARRRPQIWDAFEQADYLVKVAEIYARMSGPHLVRLDTQAPPETVHQNIMSLVWPRLPQRKGAGATFSN